MYKPGKRYLKRLQRIRNYLWSQGYESFDGISDVELIVEFAACIGHRIDGKRTPGRVRHWLRKLCSDGLFPRDEFYRSEEWKSLRREVLERYGRRCMKCSSTGQIQVDHVLPRSKFPQRQLDFGNCQVLCRKCNRSKSDSDFTDYRPCTQAGNYAMGISKEYCTHVHSRFPTDCV